ncbi:MAG: hypothetical protein A2283_21800 [Lentisphaerae bacterium RIFOXYA12_FULL_48_11]|nr:MAG: hypothetical protein A2283_21800 [Lentisphaerae bacterium RIFOXYA12_FULL_48_11]
MNLSGNLAVSFVISVALHGVVVFGVATLVMVGTADVVPGFKQGISSVMITLDEHAVPSPAPLQKIPKSASKLLDKKTEVIVKSKIEPVKAIIPTPPIQQAKTVLQKREEPRPVVAIKPDDDSAKSAEEYSILEDDMYHGDVYPDEVEDVACNEKIEESDESVSSEKTEEGVQSFANTESVVDVRPSYPLGARMRGEEGVVVVRVTVSPSGRAENVEIMKSSGYAALDGSAVSAIKKARFVAKNGGSINGGKVTLPFRFKLVN